MKRLQEAPWVDRGQHMQACRGDQTAPRVLSEGAQLRFNRLLGGGRLGRVGRRSRDVQDRDSDSGGARPCRKLRQQLGAGPDELEDLERRKVFLEQGRHFSEESVDCRHLERAFPARN